MPSQMEKITKSVDGVPVKIGTVETFIADMVGDDVIATYEASLTNVDGIVGSYDTFEEAVEALHEAYDNHIGGNL